MSDKIQGRLSEGVLPGLLRDLYVGRKTGLAHFNRGEERRSVRFLRGHISHASTNVAEDRLGNVLVRLGLLSEADRARASDVMEQQKKRLGQVLLELGLMTKDKLGEALALHVRELLVKLFEWDDGYYSFEEEEAGVAGEDDVTQRLSTGEIILEAVRQVEDPDILRYALGDIDRVLAQSTDPLLRFQNITLSPVDGFLLSRVEGNMSAREVIDLAPVSPEEAEKSLFGLLCTGMLEWAPGPPKARSKREPTGRFRLGTKRFKKDTGAAPAAPPAASAAARPGASAPAPPPTAAATAAPPLADAEKQKATQARRQEIAEAAEGLKTKNHFELLGIPRASNETQVKEAYFKLARRFHPDTQHDPELRDLAGQIEAIFIRIGQAYEVLRNPKTRASYEERLGPSRPPAVAPQPTVVTQPARGPAPPPAPPQQAPAAAPPPPAAKSPESGTHLLEHAIRQAEKALAQEKYWDVIQLIEPHLAAATGRLKVRAQLTIAKAYSKNPNWIKRAEEELQKVVQADPVNVEAHMLLAGIYKASGLKARAVSMYKKALELKPDLEAAAQALSELGADAGGPPTPQPGAVSFFKKLFKKD